MIRPITTLKPPPPPRVDPKANAEQITRLQAEATKLHNEIRLANKMGEPDAAASARQRLTQVNAELTTAQPTAPAAQPTPPATQPGPVLPTAGAATPQGNGGTTVPLFTQNFGGSPNLVLAGYTPDDGVVSPEVTKAEDIVKDIDGGKSIDNIAEERGMTPEQVVAALNAGDMTATATEYANGDTRQVVITDGSGRTITENQDYHHGGYYTEVTGPDGQATSSPIRDDLGRTETTSVDPETGSITTKFVADLGDGSVTERTTNPQTRITTTTETNGNGAVTSVTKNLPNGARVETVMPPAGSPALPVTTVTGPGGEETILAHSQAADGSGAPSIQEQLAEGKSFEEIAEASNLTPEQVIAELNAAGLEVTQGGDKGETLQIIVTDPDTGKTVTYNNDYHHGSTSVTTIEGNTETTDSIDGNGRTTHIERNTETGEQTTTIVDPKNNTETTIVFDKDGRRTETIVETLNDGEPIDYEVQPGDNLSDIAEAHGVTLEELAESNPELFTSPRDPDLIHPGETVVIEGGTKTTVKVTFNGYTVTENPDGTVTVANQEHGYEIELEAGSLEADLAGLLTEVNPTSSDPQEAREAETVLNTLDGVFASEAIEQEGAGLDLEAVEGLGEVSAATREVIEEHGPGILAEPVIDQDGGVLDLYGERPDGAGADWVPVDWQGAVRWVHPDVARALIADSETLATISELSAVIDLSNAQSDVYALDSDYTDAQAGAEDALNEVLNPHGYSIDFKKPEGSLEDAREALTAAQTVLGDAAEVRRTFEEASSTLDAAIEANRELDPLAAAPDPNAPEATAEDSNIHTDVYQQEDYATSRAEHAEVEALFGEYNRLIAEGDLGSIDLAITRNEQAGVDTQSPDHQNLLGLRDLAQNRVELGQANADYLRAESDLRTFEADSARMMREMFDKWAEGNSGGDTEMYARAYVTADGQAMIDVYYDRGDYVEEYNIDRPASHHSRYGQSIRLSVFDQDLNPEVSRNPPGSWIDKSLNTAWNEHVATGVPDGKSLNTAWNEHPEGIPEEVEIYTHGQTFIAGRENAAADLNELIASNADTALEGLNEGLTAAKSQFESDLAEHGPGTTELPDGAFPDGVEPVSMESQGQTIMLSPEVKEQLEAGNLDAVIESGTPIQVQIDVTPDDGEHNPESRWVAPELALSTLDLAAINTEIGNIEVFRDQLNGTAAGQRDTAENTENYYMPNLVQDERLENDKENVLNADFQPQFQSLYQNGFDGSFHIQKGDALEQTIQDSLGLDAENEDHADIIESVAEGIREFGGDTPEVSTIPIFYVDENGTSQTMLFGVRNDEGETVYVDITGKSYTDIEDFRHNNEQFSDDGRIVYAKDLDMTPGEDGRIEIDAQQARVLSAWESAIDPIVGIGTGIATILSFTPAAPIAAPIALAGGAYLGTRAVINQHEHISRGGDWDDTQSIMNLASIATTALPLGSSALRLGGLVRAGVPRGTAFMASIGGMRATSAHADDVGRYMQSGATSNRIAYGINATTLAAGVPLVGVSGYDIVVNGGDMNGLQFANAVLNLGAGAFGTGMGLRGLRTIPGRGGQASNVAPDSPVPVAPGHYSGGQGPRPRAVYEMGTDGVYRPTGKYTMPDPNEIVIDGDVVGDTPGQQGTGFGGRGGSSQNAPEAGNPTGQRALPAGESEGPTQPPGGRGDDPSGDGQSSRPMVVHEQGPDGVYRPTDEVVFHDSSHPVVEGTVVNVHDDGPTAGERGDPENASDRSAQGTRDQNARQPADGDPIVVPPVRDGGSTHPADGGFRMVWDPETKTFTGMPRPDPADYVYTSGKDPQQTSYLEGARPSDPAVKVTPDELLMQSETETRDGSSRETTERQGPSGAKLPEGGAEGTRPLMRYTLGNRHTGEMLVDFNLPEGQRVVAIPEPKAITAAPESTPAPVVLDPSMPVLYLGADGRWSSDPNASTELPAVTDTGHPSSVRPDGTPIINSFSSNPYSLGQTGNAVKAGLRRIGTRYLNTEPRYDYPKLGELVDSVYHRPVPQDGVTAGQDIYVEAGGEYLPAKVIVAGPQASMTRDIALPGEHATEAGYLGSGPTVERAKRGSITTPNGQLRVNTPAREVHTFDPADNPEISHRSALGETLATTLPALPDDAATPAPTWTPEQVELVGDYLHSLERSSDPVVRDAVTMTRVQLGDRGLPQSGTEMTQAQHHALVEMLYADGQSPFTGSKPVGQLSMNGLTTLQVFSAQGKLPHLSPGEVIDQLGLSSDSRLPGGEQSLVAGALPGEARWTDAGRGIVGDYLKAASGSTDPNLAAAANAASPLFKGRATKPGKAAVTAAQQDALLQVLQVDSGSMWVYGPKLQPESSFKPAGKLSPEGRYNERVLSGHETWTPHLWREMRGYAANQQKSADPAVQSLAGALENALPGSKPKAGTEINSEVPVLLDRLLAADKASSWRAPTFFTDAQGVWRSDRATVSWFLQEHEANVLGGPVLNDMATNGAFLVAGSILGTDARTVTLGGSMLGIGIKVPLPSRQVYGELSLKNNGPDGTGFLLPVHPNDAKGQKLFANGYRPNFAYDESAAPSAQWVASAPILSKNTFQSENATGVSISIAGFSVSGAYVKRTLLYLGGEGGRPGYTHREPGPLSQRAASFWEEAARGGASHYSAEGKVPGFEDRVLYRNYNVIPPFGGGKESWRSSPAFEGVPRETGAGPLNRLDRTDHGAGLAVNFGQWPVTTVELGSVRKDLVPHTRSARAHPESSEGAQKVFSALETSDGRLTPDVLDHLDAYLAEVAASPHGDLRFAGQRVSDVFPELGSASYPDQLATASGRPDGMSGPAWKALRQQLDQQARGELTPTQAHYLNRLLEQDVLHNSPPPNALPPAGGGPIVPWSPGPRPAPKGQGFAAEGSLGPSSAKPLTKAEIAANRQEAASMLDDMLHQNLGMREVTKADLADQLSRSPTLMELLRGAHAKGVRIVNPARNDLRIFDANSGDDLTATGSQYNRDVYVVSVDAQTFRAPDADSDTVLAEFVDLLAHELSHVRDAPVDLRPEDAPGGQAYGDAYVSAYMKPEGEATFVQYAGADELAANGGKPASILGAEWNQAQADVYARYKAGEIDRAQAVEEMAVLHRQKSPSTADGTYEEFYRGYADAAYRQYQASNGLDGLNPGARVLAVGHDSAALRNAGDLRITSLSPHGRGISALRGGRTFDRIIVGNDVIPHGAGAEQMKAPLQALSDLLNPGGQIHLTGVGDESALGKAVDGIKGLTLTRSPEGAGPHFRLTKVVPGQEGGVTPNPTHIVGGPHAPAPANKGQPASNNNPLTRDGVRAVPLDQVQNLNMGDFQKDQVAWLTREQVANLTEQQFGDMGRLGLLPHLTKSQLRGIPKAKIGELNVAGLEARQIPWLTNGQVGKLSETQFGDLGRADLLPHLTRPQLQGIPGDKIGFLDVSKLDAPQVPWLKPKQVGNFTQQQLKDLGEAGHLPQLSREQLRAVPETNVGVLNAAKFDPKQVSWLADGQVAALTGEQFSALGEAGLLKQFTQSQLRAVPETKIGLVDVTKFDPAQIPWLTREQVANLTEQQFKDLGEAGLLKNFTEGQVQAIPADKIDVAKLDPAQVPWLTDKQIAALTRDQWGAFTVNHIEAMTRPQIEAMTPKQFEELSPGQFRKFTLEQFEWMSTDQANALSVLQLTTFRTAYKKTMTPLQRTLVEGALVYSRTRENQMALDTFGTMASSSVMLWSSLPPHWTATAGGVMFALRGVVFSAQSVFPKATAPHTKLGRALNLASGLSFIASSPGAAAPLAPGGADANLAVNGPFTLGNMIYGTKSTMQAFTGRTTLRLLGDHVGNFAYLGGSLVYTAQSLDSPLGWISGSLFTLGSAEFWGSAIRTEVLNRKAPPRTDAEIAAAAKADKRWAAWDRIALGVTFGIGMFLFAWDTLDGEPWKVAAPDGQDPTKPDEPTGTDQPDEPDDPPPVEPEPEPEPEEYPQLVVTADDGLNLRATPGTDGEKVTVLEPGTFVEQTGKPSNDSGETWIPVEGFGPDGKTYTGWVASDYVATHPEGASNPEGRTNPKLEESGYEWVEVRDGDSIRLIASTRSADVAETVVLNMDHILSPDVVFAGDRIYLPVTATG